SEGSGFGVQERLPSNILTSRSTPDRLLPCPERSSSGSWACLSWSLRQFGSPVAKTQPGRYAGRFAAPALGRRVGVKVAPTIRSPQSRPERPEKESQCSQRI